MFNLWINDPLSRRYCEYRHVIYSAYTAYPRVFLFYRRSWFLSKKLVWLVFAFSLKITFHVCLYIFFLSFFSFCLSWSSCRLAQLIASRSIISFYGKKIFWLWRTTRPASILILNWVLLFVKIRPKHFTLFNWNLRNAVIHFKFYYF